MSLYVVVSFIAFGYFAPEIPRPPGPMKLSPSGERNKIAKLMAESVVNNDNNNVLVIM